MRFPRVKLNCTLHNVSQIPSLGFVCVQQVMAEPKDIDSFDTGETQNGTSTRYSEMVQL